MTSVSKDPRGENETEAKEDLELVWEAKEDQGETKEKERETFIYGTITTEEPKRRFVFHNKQGLAPHYNYLEYE